jgi:DNA-binding transcriptional ArsR family regulator
VPWPLVQHPHALPDRARPVLGRPIEDAARLVEAATGVEHEFDAQIRHGSTFRPCRSCGGQHSAGHRFLSALVECERSVGALVDAVGMTQSALSQHLAKLRAVGIVATRREAQTIYYRLASAAAGY